MISVCVCVCPVSISCLSPHGLVWPGLSSADESSSLRPDHRQDLEVVEPVEVESFKLCEQQTLHFSQPILLLSKWRNWNEGSPRLCVPDTLRHTGKPCMSCRTPADGRTRLFSAF